MALLGVLVVLRARLNHLVVSGLDVELHGGYVKGCLVVGLGRDAAGVWRHHALARQEEHVLRAGLPVRWHGDGDGIDARLARRERKVRLEVREAALAVVPVVGGLLYGVLEDDLCRGTRDALVGAFRRGLGAELERTAAEERVAVVSHRHMELDRAAGGHEGLHRLAGRGRDAAHGRHGRVPDV